MGQARRTPVAGQGTACSESQRKDGRWGRQGVKNCLAVTAASKGNLAVSNELCKETVAVSVRTVFRREIVFWAWHRKGGYVEQIAAGSNRIRREKNGT